MSSYESSEKFSQEKYWAKLWSCKTCDLIGYLLLAFLLEDPNLEDNEIYILVEIYFWGTVLGTSDCVTLKFFVVGQPWW